jgi:synaptobrevin family protein YKT6
MYLGIFQSYSAEKVPNPLVEIGALEKYNYFIRPIVLQHLRVVAKIALERTDPGVQHTISAENQGHPITVHVLKSDTERNSCVVITNSSYPHYVAHKLINESLEDIGKERLTLLFQKYQKPEEVDKLVKIQNQLTEVQEIMKINIENVLKRGEKLDTILIKSEELSKHGVKFHTGAKKLNSCCKY